LTAAKQRASGDYTSAEVSQRRAKGEIAGQGIGIGARKMEENLAYSEQYKSALQGIDSLNQLYGGTINKKSAEENNRYGMELWDRAVESAKDTGLDMGLRVIF